MVRRNLFLILMAWVGIPTLLLAAPKITNVEVTELTPQKLISYVTYIGHLIPSDRITVSTELGGVIESVNFKEGAVVEQNQLMLKFSTSKIQLNHRLNQANYELALLDYERETALFSRDLSTLTRQLTITHDLSRSNYELALADYNREKKLATRKLSTQSKVETLKNRMQVAKFKLELSRLDLEKSKINTKETQNSSKQFTQNGEYVNKKRKQINSLKNQVAINLFRTKLTGLELEKSMIMAPISGIVSKKMVDLGEYVGKGKQIFEVINIKKIQALVNIPETEIRFVRLGKRMDISLDALPDRKFRGVIKKRAVEANLRSRSFAIEVEINNAKRELLPGMLARIKMPTLNLKNQLLISRHAIQEDEKGSYVYVVENKQSQKRMLQLGINQDNLVQVLGGLNFGDQLITTGQQLITDRESVNVLTVHKQ